MIESFFRLEEHNTTLWREVGAGFTTFITMAYIIFVNPQMMAAAGMDQGASFVATCFAAALACLVMGVYANWPVGLAPGMGLNAFFTYTIVAEMGYSWNVALGAVFIAGVLFVVMSVTPLRGWILGSIPMSLRIGMGAGVGLFIGMIGLQSGGIIADHPSTLLTLGELTTVDTILAAFGFLLITGLSIKKVPGAILIGVLTVTMLGLASGLVTYEGIFSAPPTIAPIFMQLDIISAMELGMVSIILSILFVNLFDTAGTLLGVATKAGIADERGNIRDKSQASLVGAAPS